MRFGVRGCRIIDTDGIERLDLAANFTALIHGHAHPALIEAARAQLERRTCFGMPTELEIALAEIICGRLAGVEQLRFTNSGIEARLARHGVEGQVTGMGSLRRLHLRGGALSDFRSVHLSAAGAARLASLTDGLFEAGVIISPTGMMALSTPITDADLDTALDSFDRVIQTLA